MFLNTKKSSHQKIEKPQLIELREHSFLGGGGGGISLAIQ
jgi:hypothetical protein